MRGVPDPYGPEPEADLEQSWSASPQWTGAATVTVRGLRGDAYAGAGTTLSVDGGDREAHRDLLARHLAGRQGAQGAATPTASASTRRGRTRSSCRRPAAARAASRATRCRSRCRCSSPSCRTRATRARGRSPRSSSSCGRSTSSARRWPQNERRGTTESGLAALRNSPYWRTWQLAQQLKRGTRTPYEFVRRVDAYLEQRLPLRRAAGARRAGPGAARALPVRHQGRLLPALLGRDGAAAALRRHPDARGHRLLARRLPQAPGRVGGARPRRALVGRGVVRRHRLGHVRPDADRHAGALADRRDRGSEQRLARDAGADTPATPARRPATRRARGASSTRPARRTAPASSTSTAGRARGCTPPARPSCCCCSRSPCS